MPPGIRLAGRPLNYKFLFSWIEIKPCLLIISLLCKLPTSLFELRRDKIRLRSSSFGLRSASYDPTRRRDKSARQERRIKYR